MLAAAPAPAAGLQSRFLQGAPAAAPTVTPALTKAQDPGQRRRVESAIKAANRADGYDSSSDDDDALGARVGGRAAIRAKVSVCPIRVFSQSHYPHIPRCVQAPGLASADAFRAVPRAATAAAPAKAEKGGKPQPLDDGWGGSPDPRRDLKQ